MREVKRLILHCTATDNPDQWNYAAVDRLHTSPNKTKITWGEYKTQGKAFSRIGYHFLINRDGEREIGRPVSMRGAGARGHNQDTVHVALHGNQEFEAAQFMELNAICEEILEEYDLDISAILGHYEIDPGKTCPNFDTQLYRDALRISRQTVTVPVLEDPETS